MTSDSSAPFPLWARWLIRQRLDGFSKRGVAGLAGKGLSIKNVNRIKFVSTGMTRQIVDRLVWQKPGERAIGSKMDKQSNVCLGAGNETEDADVPVGAVSAEIEVVGRAG